LAGEIRETYFHGVDKALDPEEVDLKKTEIMNDKLFRMAGIVEARKLGLDQNPQFVREMAEFERRLLFDIFMQKVVTPEVRPTEKEMQDYYAAHGDEYMTPTMFKVRSLAFYKRADAENAAGKLNRGSDFKWVSANVVGMVDFEDQSLLQFDNKILSLTALPESLKGPAADARRGEALVYAEPNNFYYVIYLQDVFPAEPRPYQQVRKEIIEIVYRQAVEKSLEEWVGKLKEAYSVMVYLAPEG
jgi:peptidyl-prolyl cis-trans isomerase C